MSASQDIADQLKKLDKVEIGVLTAAGVSVVGSGALAVITGSPRLFAIGAGVGALIVAGYLIMLWADKDESENPPAPVVNQAPTSAVVNKSPAPLAEAPPCPLSGPIPSGVGAPMWQPGPRQPQPTRTFANLNYPCAAKGYPAMHRIPESEFWTDELDDRIRWPVNGKLGPYLGDRGAAGFWP